MKKILLYILIIFSSLSGVNAQLISFSRVGVIGQFPTGGYASSLATSFNNAGDCVKLNTGVTLFGGLFGRNDFFIACKPIMSDESFEFNLFPNPVVNYTRLVASGLPISITAISIVIVDALGRTILRSQFDPRVLRTGYVISFSNYLSGNYYLRIHGNGLYRVIPFVKVQ